MGGGEGFVSEDRGGGRGIEEVALDVVAFGFGDVEFWDEPEVVLGWPAVVPAVWFVVEHSDPGVAGVVGGPGDDGGALAVGERDHGARREWRDGGEERSVDDGVEPGTVWVALELVEDADGGASVGVVADGGLGRGARRSAEPVEEVGGGEYAGEDVDLFSGLSCALPECVLPEWEARAVVVLVVVEDGCAGGGGEVVAQSFVADEDVLSPGNAPFVVALLDPLVDGVFFEFCHAYVVEERGESEADEFACSRGGEAGAFVDEVVLELHAE